MEIQFWKSLFEFWVILVVMMMMLMMGVKTCPTDCSCKWSRGKQTVECLNRSLRTFPGPIDAGTQVLDLSGNSFETLPSDHFMRLSLINLQKIYLARCRLNHINSRAFRGLSNLVDLDLSQNILKEIPSPAFTDCRGLMRLVLSGNPIRQVLSKSFLGLQSLTTLEMSSCATEVIEKGGFEGLDSLEWLKLEGNKLRRLDGLDLLPTTLKGVWLEENPWECDCRLLELRIWLAQTKKVGKSSEPKCSSPPRLINVTLREMQLQAFACPPQPSPTTMYQKIGEGKNVSLLCKVTSTPESTLEWWFNGQPINNASLNLLVETTTSRSNGESGSLKKSELFILNATAEENGTFLCLATNPAGTAMANFTVRVLSPVDTEYAQNVTSFVGSYPNLFLIVVSAVAVVGLVILLLGMTLLLCKCSRLFGREDQNIARRRQICLENRVKSDGSKEIDPKDLNKCGSGVSLNVSNTKIERHLSETSTMTTQTKSNGSVFLLSSELGDSNPDLIEGAKRVVVSNVPESTSSSVNTYQQHLLHPINGIIQNPSCGHLEQFTEDYGLPKGLNVSTLVRRSPSYPLNNGNSAGSTSSFPPTYDFAKYPKEYINPTPLHPPNPAYLYAYGPGDGFQQPIYTYVAHGGPYALYGPQEFLAFGPPPASASCSCILEEESDTGPLPVVEAMELKTIKLDPSKAKSRLQRQVTTTINESPDEGYEDETADV